MLELDYAAACTPEERRRYALCKDWLYIVRRPAESDLIRKAPASVNRASAAGKAAAEETPAAAPAGKTTAAAEPTAEEAAAARPANAPTPESTAEPASRPARA